MASNEINEKELEKNLLKIYEAFIKNPEDKQVYRDAIDYDKKYRSIIGYNGEYGDLAITLPEKIKNSIGFLSFLCQYGSHNDDSELSKDKIFSEARKILENLRKTE